MFVFTGQSNSNSFFFGFLPLPCHVFSASVLFCASMSNKVLVETLLPSANLTAVMRSHCPSLFNPNEILDGVELGGMRGFCSSTV